MTDTSSSNANSITQYSSEAEGLRQAAADHRAQQQHLSAETQANEDNRAALDQALGVTEPESDAPQPPDPAQPPEQTEAEPSQQPLQDEMQSEWPRADEARAAHLRALQVAEGIATVEFLREFPEIKSRDDLHALAHSNPERYVRAHAALNRAQAVIHEQQQLDEQAAREAQVRYRDWAKQQDDIFQARHPELKDPKVARQMSDLTRQELRKVGLSEPEIAALYRGQQDISFRDARTQEILLDAIRWRASKQRMKEIASKPLPAVQRPGTRTEPMPGEQVSMRAAEKAMDANPSLRNAMRLMQARRAAGRR